MLKKYSVFAALAAIVALGAFLRFHKLGFDSLWMDEAVSYTRSVSPLPEMLTDLEYHDDHPPLYFLMLKCVNRFFPASETVLRFPSAIAGVLAIIAMFFLGRRLYSEKEGLISAAFTAVLWYPILFSRQARPYEFLMLFTILSVYFLVPLLRAAYGGGPVSSRQAVPYILSALITSYLHNYGVFIIILEGAAALWAARKKQRPLLACSIIFLVIFICYLPWVTALIHQYFNRSGTSWIQKPDIYFFFYYIRHIFDIYDPFHLFTLVYLPYIFFLSSFFYGAFKQKDRGTVFSFANPDFLLLSWLIVPYALLFLGSILAYPVLGVRYLIIIFPAACLLLARSLALLPLKTFHTGMIAFLAAYIFLFKLVFSHEYYVKPTFIQVREAVKLVSTLDRGLKSSVTILYASSYFRENYAYYFQKTPLRDYIETEWNKEDVRRITSEIRQKKPGYVWLLTPRQLPDLDKEFEVYFKNDPVVLNQEFVGLNVKLIKLGRPR